MLDNITPIKSDREALKEIQTIIAAKSEAVKRHQVGVVKQLYFYLEIQCFLNSRSLSKLIASRKN